MELQRNVVGWFEIPVKDLDRAVKFYESVFKLKLEKHKVGDLEMAWFPFADKPGAPGALVHDEKFYSASDKTGVLIYFSSQSGDVNNELMRIEEAGGKILKDKTLITEDIGYMGVFLDSEGNRIAIHSLK